MSKKLMDLINKTASSRHPYNVFSDFVEMSALAISNSCDKRFYDEREARYMSLIGRYEKNEQQNFPAMLAEFTTEMEKSPRDILGEIYMEMGFGGNFAGQFFTPMPVSFLCGELCIDSADEIIKQKGFVTLSDCAIGAGAMPLAFALAFKEAGHNYQTQLHVSGTDVDVRCVHMVYLQLSILGIPAVIHHGNSLTNETYEEWKTPFHILFNWDHRLRHARENSNVVPALSPALCEESSGENQDNLMPSARLGTEQVQMGLF